MPGCLSIFRASSVVNGEPYNAKNRKDVWRKKQREVILMRENDLLSSDSGTNSPPLTLLNAILLLRQRKLLREGCDFLVDVPSRASRLWNWSKIFSIEGKSDRWSLRGWIKRFLEYFGKSYCVIYIYIYIQYIYIFFQFILTFYSLYFINNPCIKNKREI